FWAARADVHLHSAFGGIADGFLWAALAWAIALPVVLAWRSERLGSWAPLIATGVELGILYYTGTTGWDWSIALSERSPILRVLSHESPVGLIGGDIEDLPVGANLKTGAPYLGFLLPRPNDLLGQFQQLLVRNEATSLADPAGAEVFKRW